MAVPLRSTLTPYERVRNSLFRRDDLRVPYVRLTGLSAAERELVADVVMLLAEKN